jgi:hypothetical protein
MPDGGSGAMGCVKLMQPANNGRTTAGVSSATFTTNSPTPYQ